MSEPAARDLDVARRLASAGVPVFLAYPDAAKPTGYSLPLKWETTAANPAYLGAWKPGMAVCAVMGHVFDVLDTATATPSHVQPLCQGLEHRSRR